MSAEWIFGLIAVGIIIAVIFINGSKGKWGG